MTYILELENKEDFPRVKKLLEQIKGAKVFEKDSDEIYPDGTPKWFIEKLADYSDSLTEDDYISPEDFMASAKRKVCELYSQK